MMPTYANIFILFNICISLIYAIDPPTVYTSYHAITEISWIDEDGDNVVMMTEENFDYKTRRMSFVAFDDSMNVTIYEDMNLNQTLIYNLLGCRVYKPKEWLKLHGPPDLEIYEINGKQIFFPLMQLFWGLPTSKPIADRKMVVYRGVSAQKWSYKLDSTSSDNKVQNSVEIDAFWSDGKMAGPAKEWIRPLGFEIRRTSVNSTSKQTKKTNQNINIFYFLRDVFNKEALQPKQGIHCSGRESSRKFPDFEDFEAFSVNIEHILPNQRSFSSVDIWVDNKRQLVQIQMDPDDQMVQPFEPKQTKIRISSNEQQIIYDIDPTKNTECKIIPMHEMQFDSQTLYDFNTLSKLDLKHFFGGNTPFIYIGEAKKRGIPCRLWQGVKRGWPPEPEFSSVTTLWEWCIAERTDNPILLQVRSLPVISLDITVIESTLTPAEDNIFVMGGKMTYNFYNFNYHNSSYINRVAFDITPCFPLELIEPLKFKVQLTTKDKLALGNSTVDADFIDAWRQSIYSASSLVPASMRVTRVKTVISGLELFIEFCLLDRHPKLPTNVNDKVNLSDAKRVLESFINSGSLIVNWNKNTDQLLTFKAVKYSLSRQYIKLKPTPIPPKSTESTDELETEETKSTDGNTDYIFTGDVIITGSVITGVPPVITESTKTREVTELPKELKFVYYGHTKGQMAGLSVGMLLLGLSLGAGGTFVKFRYFHK